MALDKIVDSSVLDAGLKTIADAIREKGGTSSALAFPGGMAEAIAAIQAGGGGEGTTELFGYKVLSGSFVLASDATSTIIVESTKGVLEANKAYTVFMGVLGTYANIYDVVGKKGIFASSSKRYNTNNNNVNVACQHFDNYGSGKATNSCGLMKHYAENHLSLATSSSLCIGKAGVEYHWIAIEDGV